VDVRVNGGIGRPVRIGVLPPIPRTRGTHKLFHVLPRQDTSALSPAAYAGLAYSRPPRPDSNRRPRHCRSRIVDVAVSPIASRCRRRDRDPPFQGPLTDRPRKRLYWISRSENL